MDTLINAAARALAVGDALGALKRVALREDPPALALRGIAMAQLGDYSRARELLRRAAREFGVNEPMAQARCIVAAAEVALAMRDLNGAPRRLAAAIATLEAHGDYANAQQARLITARRLVLLGQLDAAAAVLPRLDALRVPPQLAAVAELVAAELGLRSLHIGDASDALARAARCAERAGVPALLCEVATLRTELMLPAARRLSGAGAQTLRLDEVASLLASGALVIDACRHGLRLGERWLPLASRPVLFTLIRTLGEVWPGGADRNVLIADAFRTRRPDATHRARLRVEIGRLRALVSAFVSIEATRHGYMLVPHDTREVVVLVPPIVGDEAELLALLSDGAAWSTSALALAVQRSQRTVQRALIALESAGRVRAIGRSRARRWLAPPLTDCTTILLLPAALPL